MAFATLALIVVSLVTVVAAITDLATFKIPNVLTLPTLAAGLISATVLGGSGGLSQSLLGAMLGFVLLVGFFALGGMGAGDVKLFMAIGAWLGPGFTLQVFVAAVISSAIYALALAILQGGLVIALTDLSLLSYQMITPSEWRRPRTRVEHEVTRPDRRKRLVPFGAMTCLAFLVLVLS